MNRLTILKASTAALKAANDRLACVKCSKCGCATDRFGFCIICFRYVTRQVRRLEADE